MMPVALPDRVEPVGLSAWVSHRAALVGFSDSGELALAVGVRDEAMERLIKSGALETLPLRSQQRRLAAALRVPLRRLWALERGEIAWIEDEVAYDADAAARPPPGAGGEWWAEQRTPERDERTPIVGRVNWAGRIERDECWDSETGRRLPDRHGNGRDVYALELELAGQFAILRNASPWEAREGAVVAAYLWDGWDGAGYFGQLSRGREGTWRIRPRYAEPIIFEAHRLLRVGRLVRRWPTGIEPMT